MAELEHIGTKRHSGRYPWGSGGHGEQRETSFLTVVKELESGGLSEVEVAAALGIKTTELREIKAIERGRKRAADHARAIALKDKGLSNSAIGQKMGGLNESSVRSILDPVLLERATIIERLANFLKSIIKKKGPIDVGGGVEASLGVPRTKLNAAIRSAERDGYNVYYIETPQLTTGKMTSIKVLAPPGMTYSDVFKTRAAIGTVTDYSPDSGKTFLGLDPIQNVSSDRISIAFNSDKDGLIELRAGISDLDLANSRYAQVRIGVDGTHYLKGMAIRGHSLPTGKDIVYHTSKSEAPAKDVFKEMTGDPDNPFGATIKKGGQRGALNMVYEEGDWHTWTRNISSQILSKQQPALAKRQLDLDKGLRDEAFKEITSIQNPVVRKQLLQAFSDKCDAAAVDLKATALPRQSSHVILPVPELKPNEIYAPMFRNGEQVVLVRHPHGGIFEIPEVVVNNKHAGAKDLLGNSVDAIGIHPDVAHKLSGADFDGDTVIAIPNDRGYVKASRSLTALKDFNPSETYPPYDGMRRMSKVGTQMHMGDVTNLITDMTIKGASQSEIARAVKHSMVVIDAEKHGLNYRQSGIDNGISQLKEKYQGSSRSGASTVISRASSQKRIPHRTEGETRIDPVSGKSRKVYIDPNTGEKLFTTTGETYTNKRGQVVERQTLTTQMADSKSAFDLSSGTKMETLYAGYADSLKSMANKARVEMVATPSLQYDREAKLTFSNEVASINAKLRLAERNRPKERKAQLVANKIYRAKLDANPNLDKGQRKRLRQQALTAARARLGAKKPEFPLSDREWLALDMGAISNNKALQVMRYTDLDLIKEHALPRRRYVMTDLKLARAKMMTASGYTPSEIASALGVSPTTIVNALGEETGG
jgi:hypothetical protein